MKSEKLRRILLTTLLVCSVAGLWLAFGRSNERDFTGQQRQHLRGDVVYDYCRRLEEQFGMQIFYLPEWTEAEEGFLHHEDLAALTFDKEYFEAVLVELEKLAAAWGQYPEGFLREVAAADPGRRVEVVICPYTYQGYSQYGYYQQDFSAGEVQVDHLYLTGCGAPQFYSHEIGHLVVSRAAEITGWQEFCDSWDACGEAWVSDYAATKRQEDWAETWAYLWHRQEELTELCRDERILAKVQLLTDNLREAFPSLAAALPWEGLLE